jgi:hypothetical protein
MCLAQGQTKSKMANSKTANYKTADLASIAKTTPEYESALGIKPESLCTPRPDLNGLRVKSPTEAKIYLIDGGCRRWIPNPETYNNLFRDWNGVVIDIDINEIPEAAPISEGAILSKGSNSPAVFLVDRGIKRWVTSPAAMDKYYFNWGRVYVVPQVLVDSIPTGSSIA